MTQQIFYKSFSTLRLLDNIEYLFLKNYILKYIIIIFFKEYVQRINIYFTITHDEITLTVT